MSYILNYTFTNFILIKKIFYSLALKNQANEELTVNVNFWTRLISIAHSRKKMKKILKNIANVSGKLERVKKIRKL